MDRTRGDIETGIEGLEIRPFDIGTASDGELRAFWAFRMREWRDVYPEDPETPFKQWLDGFRNSTLFREARFWAIWNADVVRGYALVHVSAAGLDPDGASISITIDPVLQRRGLGSRLLAEVTRSAEQEGRRFLSFQTLDRYPAGAAFCEAIGAVVQSVSHTNRLLLADVDTDVIARWLELPDDRSEIEIVEWRDGPPDDRLRDLCAFHQEIYDAEPAREGSERREFRFTPEYLRQAYVSQIAAGASILTLAALSIRDGSLLGCTETAWNPAKPAVINQMFTGVRPASRGKGLARRLKAGMLSRIVREHPGVTCIRSGNVDANQAINRINRELGYRHWIARTDWRADIASVRKYLRKRNLLLILEHEEFRSDDAFFLDKPLLP